MSRRSRTTRIHALILLTHTSWLVCASSSLQAAEPAQPVEALWRQQQVEFTYRGDTAVYTCRDLVYRVTTVLRAVGSQPEVTARGQCIDFSRMQAVTIALRSPAEATPERVRDALTVDATHRLLAHLRGEPLPTATDLERFPARWQRVSLTKLRRLRLRPSDCDLLHAIAEQLFSKLTVRRAQDWLRCASPSSQITPRFELEALLPWRSAH